MAYQPKIVTARIKGTGWPIDGHVLYLSQWDYDRENWHLYGWEDEDDEAVMLTIWQTESEAGMSSYDTLEDFAKAWKAKEWDPQCPFCFDLSLVEVLEIKQEERPDENREKLLAHGIDLTPRKGTDKGGILCLPMAKNLNGDIKAKHPDWELIKCPSCGWPCWKTPEADRMVETQRVQLLCTECALRAGLIRAYKQQSANEPGGNRAQRRRAKRDK